MPPSSPSPDRFQREIDDIIRLAEKRLERQSFKARARSSSRPFRRRFSGLGISLPPPENLAGWGLVLLLLAWLLQIAGGFLSLGVVGHYLTFAAEVVGIGLLALGIALSLLRGRSGSGGAGGSGGSRMWRGERVSYGNPYGDNAIVRRIKEIFRGRG